MSDDIKSEELKVRYWTTFSKGERNYPNHHAEYAGVEFFAFPFQPYMTHVDHLYAIIGDFMSTSKTLPLLESGRAPIVTIWSARICDRDIPSPTGHKANVLAFRHFEENKDAAFIWAVHEMQMRLAGE